MVNWEPYLKTGKEKIGKNKSSPKHKTDAYRKEKGSERTTDKTRERARKRERMRKCMLKYS